MRIVIDMQGAQTESRFRGIGRYTMAFAKAVVRNRGGHEIILALSGLFPETIDPIRAAFKEFLPQSNIRVWEAPGPLREAEKGNDARRETAEILREAFLASLQPDVIHLSSLFEGYVDDAVTSIGLFDVDTPLSVILFDLIPLQNPNQYLETNSQYKKYYLRKVEFLRKASVFLAISEFTRQEGIEVLGIQDDEVVNISTAIDNIFKPIKIFAPATKALQEKFSVTRPFVLYTGGADERKNLPRLIEAYSMLSADLRNKHQLVFSGKIPEGNIATLKRHAEKNGLKQGELLFTGYVTDEELVQLYKLCSLFVFPSWHEGFGLPALEAMACGAAVIGANTSSLPEVIGLPEALFDSQDAIAISQKITEVLKNEGFCARLREHGLEQAKRFSWDETAIRAIHAWERLHCRHVQTNSYISRSTVHDKLISALVNHIDSREETALISLADSISKNESVGIERQLFVDVSELCQHDSATGVQRVVRSHLKYLLQSPPKGFRVEPVFATVNECYRYARSFTMSFLGEGLCPVNDDYVRWQRGDVFFGLDMQHHVQLANARFYTRLKNEGVVVKFLVHDLLPIEFADFFKDSGARELHEQWLTMIAATDEAICVSKATADAYDSWLRANLVAMASGFRISWVHNGGDIEGSIPSFGLPNDAKRVLSAIRQKVTFLCVSTIEPRKQQQQILEAVELLWKRGVDVNLVFVGNAGWKTEVLIGRLESHTEINKRLFWLKGISDEYLERIYENSGCLISASLNEGFGLPLIEAARHGLPILARDIPVFREVAGDNATYFEGETGVQLAAAMSLWLQANKEGKVPSSNNISWLSWQQSTNQLIDALIARHCSKRQLFVDISELVQRDAKSGIQRVVRSLLHEWLTDPDPVYRVEPVYASHVDGYRYARRFTKQFMNEDSSTVSDDLIDFSPGDVFLGLDLAPAVVPAHGAFYKQLSRYGVRVAFVIYDLLPLMDGYFESAHADACNTWLNVATSGEAAICISDTVAKELYDWIYKYKPEKLPTLSIRSFHLGADIDRSIPTDGLPNNAEAILKLLGSKPSFLLVSTLAPHKGHGQVLDAYEILWEKGYNINLVFVGKQGWLVDSLVDRIHKHRELNKSFFWLEGISDEFLEKLYETCACLVVASYAEGFGLPLIEAAQHKLPIIARDIPVFREVAGDYAYYFEAETANGLSEAIIEWMALYEKGLHPQSINMPFLTWNESASQLLQLIKNSWDTEIAHD